MTNRETIKILIYNIIDILLRKYNILIILYSNKQLFILKESNTWTCQDYLRFLLQMVVWFFLYKSGINITFLEWEG